MARDDPKEKILRELNKAKAFLMQENPQVRIQYVFLLIIVISAVFILFEFVPLFLCDIAGCAYPIYASFKSMETQKNQQQWLLYWMIFGVVSLVDVILSWIPFYYLFRLVFLVYLYLPVTMGTSQIFEFIKPHLKSKADKDLNFSFDVDQLVEKGKQKIHGVVEETINTHIGNAQEALHRGAKDLASSFE